MHIQEWSEVARNQHKQSLRFSKTRQRGQTCHGPGQRHEDQLTDRECFFWANSFITAIFSGLELSRLATAVENSVFLFLRLLISLADAGVVPGVTFGEACGSTGTKLVLLCLSAPAGSWGTAKVIK